MNSYYSLKKEEVIKNLGSSEKGLTSSEAKERLKRYNRNVIREKDRRTSVGILLSQFKSPLTLILLFATVLAFLMGETINAVIIAAIVFISSFLGFYQEFKSDRALEALKNYISFKAKVQRDGEKIEVDVRDLVPGDIVSLNLGDIVPADIRIIESEDLYANESIITGEVYPVRKISSIIKGENLPLTKRFNMLFMGSEISEGLCTGIVVSTGENTEFGRTARILSSKEPPSNFQNGINNFGGFLVKLVFVLTAFVFATNFFLGKGIFDSFLFAIALAVGVTPELLPAIMTISMSKGAIKMAEKKVVIKKLVSIEDMGNMDVLCTDKTGTLTENKIILDDYFDINNNKNEQLLQYALICNSAISHKHKISGNILDRAIVDYSNSHRIKVIDYKRIGEVGFDYTRKRMSSIVNLDNRRVLICKGNTLSVLEACSKIKNKERVESISAYRKKIIKKFEDLSKKGLRVISIGYKEAVLKKEYSLNDEKDLIFLGFLVFFDPPRKDVKETLMRLDSLGVSVKILTGDSELVTREVCKKVGFKIEGEILCGEELEKMSEQEFLKSVETHNVFARVIPEQKFRIVSGLIKNGHITGFLGDGVNDAPALKIADVGISVDSAVDVARNNADIILLKKSLRVISDGVLEGRRTFGNSTKYILNTISANFGNMFTLSISSLYFRFIPLLPSQILLVNFVSDIPMVTVSTDNVDESYLKKPKKWNLKMIKSFMIFFGIVSSFFDIVTILIVWFFIAPDNPAMFRTVWFTESVLSEILVTFVIRTRGPFWRSRPSKLLVFASVFGVFLTLFAIFSPIGEWFQFESLSLTTLAIIGAILLAYLALAEIGKNIFYSKIFKEG